jgi:NAD(P)-dependent dehydrogenase (short-subunit alcohol dehydrogenase family)
VAAAWRHRQPGQPDRNLLIVLVERFGGQAIVVTGVGSGIGRATALRLAEEGAVVVGIDSVAESLDETKGQVLEAGGRGGAMLTYRCDVSDPTLVSATVADIVARLPVINALVNSAGIGTVAHSTDQPVEEWQHIIDVNLSGTFFMCRAVLPRLLESRGRIVNMASIAGLIGQPYNAAYCASKGGVIALTRALATEYVDRGVTVNAIAPSGIETPLITDVTIPDGVVMAKFDRLASPMGLAQPSEVAGLVAFLLSDEARYMTGSIVTMDGGVSV